MHHRLHGPFSWDFKRGWTRPSRGNAPKGCLRSTGYRTLLRCYSFDGRTARIAISSLEREAPPTLWFDSLFPPIFFCSRNRYYCSYKWRVQNLGFRYPCSYPSGNNRSLKSRPEDSNSAVSRLSYASVRTSIGHKYSKELILHLSFTATMRLVLCTQALECCARRGLLKKLGRSKQNQVRNSLFRKYWFSKSELF